MYAATPTKLSLVEWAKIMGIHPLHFAQVQLNFTDGTATPNCGQPFVQYGWQAADATARDEIARVIAQAETMIENQLGFRLLPSWEVDEWQQSARFFRPELFNTSNTDLRGYAQAVKANWGRFITGGVKAKAVLGLSDPITYSDPDSDGYDERATVALTGLDEALDPCEVHVYYPGHSGDEAFEIRPIAAEMSGTTLTITFRRELAVLESLIEDWRPEGVFGDDDASFLTEVDVYRIYNDPSTMADLLWEGQPGGGGLCGGAGCSVCQYVTQSGCLNARGNKRDGFLSFWPSTWVPEDNAFSQREVPPFPRMPDIVRLNYLAGLEDPNVPCPRRDLDRTWARTVAILAAALLDRPPCGCQQDQWERWAADLAFTGGAEEFATYNLSTKDLDNPFGTRRGMVYAWKRVNEDDAANVRVAFIS